MKEVINEYNNPDLCRECGGICCRRSVVLLSPSDFRSTSKVELKKAYENGQFTISYLSIKGQNGKVSKVYYPRVLVRGESTGDPVKLVDQYDHQTCSYLDGSSCKFEFYDRPRSCRVIKPRESKICIPEYTLTRCINDWKSHQSKFKYIIKSKGLEVIESDGSND